MEAFESLEFSNTLNLAQEVDCVLQTAQEIENLQTCFPSVPRVVFRDQLNPLEVYNDFNFKANFGFSKDGFINVLDIYKNRLESKSNRGNPISPLLKLSVFLQYLRLVVLQKFEISYFLKL